MEIIIFLCFFFNIFFGLILVGLTTSFNEICSRQFGVLFVDLQNTSKHVFHWHLQVKNLEIVFINFGFLDLVADRINRQKFRHNITFNQPFQ